MTISRRARFLSAVGAIALVPAALVACSGGGQSVEEACTVANDTITEAMGDLTSVTSDPEAAMGVLDDAMAAMKEAGDKIENEEVKATYDTFNGAFDDFQEVMSSGADDPANLDVDALTEISTTLQDSVTEIQELCG